MKKEKKMTIDSHNRDSRGFEEDYNRRKVEEENAKVNGKRMSQEEIDKEIAEMKEQLKVRLGLEEKGREIV